MPSDPSGRFQVVWPGPVLQQVRALGERAKERGLGPTFAAQVRHIIEKLSTEPRSWGEQRRTLACRNLPVHHAAVPLLHVQYAVDEAARVVFVMEVRLMTNSPLAEP